MGLLDIEVRELLEQLAAEERTPASGALAALVVAGAAGLLEKAARNARDDWTEAGGTAAQAAALRARAATLAETDVALYAAALSILAERSDGSPEQRDYAVGSAFAAAAEPPARIAELACDVALLAVTVVRAGALEADAAAAGTLAAAAAQAAAGLVAVNLTAGPEDARVARAREFADQAARAAVEVGAGA